MSETNNPMNSPPSPLCCQYHENCTDGMDNNFDGNFDCTDEECIATAGGTPLTCTGSPYDSDTCVQLVRDTVAGTYTVTYNDSCKAADGNSYYCSYPESSPSGVCCKNGTYAVYDSVVGYYCEESAECGLKDKDPLYPCNYDFDLNRNDWLNDEYNGDVQNWCVSRMPNLIDPFTSVERSAACCLIVKAGEVNYYTEDENVLIFGTS